MRSFSLVLVAGGVSRRMGKDKLLMELAGATVLERSLSAFFPFKEIAEYIVVCSDEGLREKAAETAKRAGKAIVFAESGESRAESVKNGLSLVKTEFVLVHDAARPFVSFGLIRSVLDDVLAFGSSVPSLPIYDSVRVGNGKKIVGAVDRSEFFLVQTPQGFRTAELLEAYRKGGADTDECGIFLASGREPHLTEGEESNRKLTRPQDVFGFGVRVGVGYDVHRMGEGRKFVLGGLEIPFEKGEIAHSDGDVLLHAVMDALLSAAEERDIGNLFPDSDPKYKGISSVLLLREVAGRIAQKGLLVSGISAVVALEKPKLAAYVSQINENIKRETGARYVNVSATTTETLGIVGAGGIAAYAVAAIVPENTRG